MLAPAPLAARPRRHAPLRVWLAALAGLWLLLAPAVHGADRRVVVLTATGVVDNVMAGYISEGIAGAERSNAAAVVIELDTPGGSLGAMLDIVESLQNATLPTVVWVAPNGASAASAGTFITLAANLAYMAPSTTIGAASPVGSGGEDITGTEGEKVRNFAISKIKALAEERGHNVDWAVSTVESAVSTSATDAASIHAVNGLASSLDELLTSIQGKQVTVGGGAQLTIDVAGASASTASMNPLQGLLHLLSDPNIAFVLFTIGLYGLIFELQSPNFVTGILGALALILAFIGFGSLPLNLAGLLLVGLGVLLFVLETQIVSHGLLAVGGIACFALGASALYTEPGGDPTLPVVQVATPLVVVATLSTAALMGFITLAAIRTRGMPSSAGTVGVPVALGSTGVVQAPLDPLGTVHLAGETWSARVGEGGMLDRNTPVRLVGFDGLTAIVEPLEPGTQAPTPTPPAPLPADRT
jgi:membrane-bound serine protease (ClpP class)